MKDESDKKKIELYKIQEAFERVDKKYKNEKF
jgi:hypothetical protein